MNFWEGIKNSFFGVVGTSILFSLVNIACSRTIKELIGGFMFIGFMELVAFTGSILLIPILNWLLGNEDRN